MRFLGSIAIILLLFYSCNPITERMNGFQVHGIDLSHHQTRVSWPTIADQNISFAFVKATEGETHTDSLFHHNWQQLKKVGILRGAYHFFRPGKSALHQALNFIHSVKMEVGDLPPVVDIEVADGVADATTILRLSSFLNIIEAHYGIRPIIYTNQKFYSRYISGHLEDYPLWIARYGKAGPRLDYGQRWTFWQYGNRGRLAGINGDVDLNVFHGTQEELAKLCMQHEEVYTFND